MSTEKITEASKNSYLPQSRRVHRDLSFQTLLSASSTRLRGGISELLFTTAIKAGRVAQDNLSPCTHRFHHIASEIKHHR